MEVRDWTSKITLYNWTCSLPIQVALRAQKANQIPARIKGLLEPVKAILSQLWKSWIEKNGGSSIPSFFHDSRGRAQSPIQCKKDSSVTPRLCKLQKLTNPSYVEKFDLLKTLELLNPRPLQGSKPIPSPFESTTCSHSSLYTYRPKTGSKWDKTGWPEVQVK